MWAQPLAAPLPSHGELWLYVPLLEFWPRLSAARVWQDQFRLVKISWEEAETTTQ